MKYNRDYELLNACYFGNKNRAIGLLREGANPNYTDPRDGWAGIHYSARWGQLQVVKELIAAGANINMLTKENETPLHIACSTNRIDVCIWLMKNGANPNLKDNSHHIPEEMTKNIEIKFLCQNFDEYMKIILEKRILEKSKK